MKTKVKKVLSVFVALCLICLSLCSCKKTTKELLIGEWYAPNSSGAAITFYDDGTFDFGPYTGIWNVVNENVLKWSIEGEDVPLELVSVDNDTFVVKIGDNVETGTFYRTAEEAAKHAK